MKHKECHGRKVLGGFVSKTSDLLKEENDSFQKSRVKNVQAKAQLVELYCLAVPYSKNCRVTTLSS